jgi:hypothetical protein
VIQVRNRTPSGERGSNPRNCLGKSYLRRRGCARKRRETHRRDRVPVNMVSTHRRRHVAGRSGGLKVVFSGGINGEHLVSRDRRPIRLVEVLARWRSPVGDLGIRLISDQKESFMRFPNYSRPFFVTFQIGYLCSDKNRITSHGVTAFLWSAGVLTKSVTAAAPIPALASSRVRFPNRACCWL